MELARRVIFYAVLSSPWNDAAIGIGRGTATLVVEYSNRTPGMGIGTSFVLSHGHVDLSSWIILYYIVLPQIT
jgi:hypothetical protein